MSICEVIQSIAKSLPIDLIQDFLSEISNLPHIKDPLIVDLISFLTMMIINSYSSPQKGSFGLKLLWKLCTEDSQTKAGGDVKIINYAIEKIGNLFSKKNLNSSATEFLSTCLEKLKKDKNSVVQSLRMIELLLSNFFIFIYFIIFFFYFYFKYFFKNF